MTKVLQKIEKNSEYKAALEELKVEVSQHKREKIKMAIKNIERYKILLANEEKLLADLVSGKGEVSKEEFLFDGE